MACGTLLSSPAWLPDLGTAQEDGPAPVCPPSTAFLYGPDDWYDFGDVGDVIQFMGDASIVLRSTEVERVERDLRHCSDDDLLVHHDGVFEQAFAWQTGGVRPPYDGAFGEAFDVGPGTVSCVALWLSQDGSYAGQSTDVYVWDGGIGEAPGSVLAVVPGIVFAPIPIWPEIGRFDFDVSVPVAGPATAGAWTDWPGALGGYGFAADADGAGHPWTHIAEGVGFPAGWQHPGIVFGDVGNMGIGMGFRPDDPVPTRTSSWGMVKALYDAR